MSKYINLASTRNKSDLILKRLQETELWIAKSSGVVERLNVTAERSFSFITITIEIANKITEDASELSTQFTLYQHSKK